MYILLDSPGYIWSIKRTFQTFVKDRSKAKLNLGWAHPGDLVIKQYFETGLGSPHALPPPPNPYFFGGEGGGVLAAA